MLNLLLLLMGAALAGGQVGAASDADMPAELCLSNAAHTLRSAEANCEAVPSSAVLVPASDGRLFLWTSGDRSRVRVGRSSRGRVSLLPDSEGSFELAFRIQGGSSTGPVDTKIRIDSDSSPADQWEWMVPDAALARFSSISLPAGKYKLTVAAPHHQPLEMTVQSHPGVARVRLGTVELKSLPAIRGRVVDRSTRRPLAGVLVRLAGGKTLAITGPDGEFREWLPAGENAEEVTLLLGGHGSCTVALPKMTADADLGTLELSAAGELRVIAKRDAQRYQSIRVRVARKEGRKRREIATRELAKNDGDWTVRDLEPGEYVVTLSGQKPLQQMSSVAKVREAETAEARMEIESIELSGTVSRRDQPVRAAHLAVKASPDGWTANVTTDDKGEFREDLWQGGRFLVTVTSPELRAPYSFVDEVKGVAGVAQWDIRIPSGTIAGRVIDAKSRQPIAASAVTLDSELSGKDSTQSLGAETDHEGRFAFEGVEAGQHIVTAEAERYAAARSPAIVFSTNDERREVELALSPATTRQVIVTSVEGRPLAGAALVHELLPPDVVPRTDLEGRVDISFSGGMIPVLLALPREGSFGVVPGATATETKEPVRVVVPPPTAGIVISVFDETTGEPIAGVNVLMRYNGVFLAPRLMALAAENLRSVLKTDSQGSLLLSSLPAGRYDLWIYGAAREAAAIMQGSVAPSAVVLASSGSQNVRMTLRTK